MSNAYVRIKVPGYPGSDRGWVREHRYVVERALARRLGASELVHHLNGDRADNRLINLFITTKTEHGSLHRTYPRFIEVCATCGKAFVPKGNQASAIRSLIRRGTAVKDTYCSAHCRNQLAFAGNSGRTRWANYVKPICAACGQRLAHARGHCNRCYERKRRRRLADG